MRGTGLYERLRASHGQDRVRRGHQEPLLGNHHGAWIEDFVTYLGWKIYYCDGSVVTSRDTTWAKAPADEVEIVVEFYKETYQIWHEDHYDTENYCHLFHGQDYYWMTVEGSIGAGRADEVPSILPGMLKVGMSMDDENFAQIYNLAKDQRVF